MNIVIPTEEQWLVLRDLGLTWNTATAIIHPDVAREFEKQYGKKIDDAILGEYDFSGDPDMTAEVVLSLNHMLIGEVLREFGIEEGDDDE